jgi:hypothetical protein
MIHTIYGDDERFRKSYYPEDFQGKYYLAGDGAIRDERPLFTCHRADRRRPQRQRPPHGHDGDRVGAGRTPPWWPGSRRRPADETTAGDLRLRRPEAAAAHRRGGAKIAKELRDWVAKEIGPIAKPRTSPATTCRRRAAARSCAAPALGRQRRRDTWDTSTLENRRSWSSSPRRTEWTASDSY